MLNKIRIIVVITIGLSLSNGCALLKVNYEAEKARTEAYQNRYLENTYNKATRRNEIITINKQGLFEDVKNFVVNQFENLGYGQPYFPEPKREFAYLLKQTEDDINAFIPHAGSLCIIIKFIDTGSGTIRIDILNNSYGKLKRQVDTEIQQVIRIVEE